MPGSPFPDVPITPGVPPVERGPLNSDSPTEPRLTRDSDNISQLASAQWGIFTAGGEQIVQPDNISGFGYSAEYRIADFPIEQGGFETYDKVALPFTTRVVMAKGGSLSERQSFHQAIEAIRGDRELYNVITPEAVYANVNVTRVELDRSQERGAGMLVVEVYLQEIRQNATAQFSKTKEAAGTTPTNSGSVQASADDPSLTSAGATVQ
jgi:hypothetical protein